MTLIDKLNSSIDSSNSLLCIGLDPVVEKMPSRFQNSETPLFDFCQYIIDETHEYVMGYKPNSAFFEAYGASGIDQLQKTCAYIRSINPELFIILDAKRADIGNTNEAYIKYSFEYLGADAITLHPYLGREAIQPFLDQVDKGSIILCRTSNPGAGEFQDLVIQGDSRLRGNDTCSLYQYVATQVSQKWNTNNNCMLVVGATYPEELAQVRKIVGDMPILVPGIGAQGGDLEKTLKAGLTPDKKGLIITVSRAVIYAENPREEAQKMKDIVNNYRLL